MVVKSKCVLDCVNRVSASLVVSGRRICLPMQERWVQSLSWEDPLEEEMAASSRILVWKIPWTGL